jgi:hypothetical protein
MSDKHECSSSNCTSCRDVVARTYFELMSRGYGDEDAFRAADHVLALRHPAYSKGERTALISHWLFNEMDL